MLISSELAATVTVSDNWPTSSTAFRDAGVPGSTRTSDMTAVLNPLSETVTEYTPGATPGTLKSPSPFDTASNDTPDSFLTTTAAPGMAPPALSRTDPEMDDVACANASVLVRTASAARRHTRRMLRVIKAPPSLKTKFKLRRTRYV